MAEIIATVKEGQLNGKSAIDHAGGTYYCFEGIPYAKPPLGNLRFKAPQPAEQWSGVRQATNQGPSCYAFQNRLQAIAGSEDCLYINVYTPNLPSINPSLKPVMVWFHGGAFTSGSGSPDSYGPDFLITQDVIIVLVNYRYGLLGFLSFEDPSLCVPGNAGLKDQVLALRWVRENINAFSGDPNNVTIFGESSGGASVHYLVMSPMAKGLFHKAIIQSGSALCCWARGQHSAPVISSILGKTAQNERDLLQVLQEMPVEELYKLQLKLGDVFSANAQRPIGPVVEKPSDEPGFLLKEPVDILKSGDYNKVPMIIGYNSREGMILHTYKKDGKLTFENDFEKIVPYTLRIQRGSDLYKEIARKIKQFYFDNEDPCIKTIDDYYKLLSDVLIVNGINETVEQQALDDSLPIYYYRVSIESRLNKYKALLGITDTGVCHADELGYLFKTSSTPAIRANSIEDIGMRRFVNLWTNFAKYGNPNPTNSDDVLINVKWNPIHSKELHYLEIGENLTVGINPDAERMAFWSEIAKLVEEE